MFYAVLKQGLLGFILLFNIMVLWLYNMLPAKLWLVTLLSSEQSSQFDRFPHNVLKW